MRALPKCLWCMPVVAALTWAQSATQVFNTSKVTAGLCVHINCGNGTVTADLTNGGKMLVHGLSTSSADVESARVLLREKGLYGLATVQRVSTYSSLPYAGNLVNLLVADLDALGGGVPPDEEIMRVLVPRGTAYVKRGGSWQSIVKPRPAEMDDWTHFDYGPEGNPVSKDKLVGPPTSLRWITWYRGSTAGYHMGFSSGLRSNNGIVFHGSRANIRQESGQRVRRQYINGRDAFNGIPLWTMDRESVPAHPKLVAAGDMLLGIAQVDSDHLLAAYDARTGERIRVYDRGGNLASCTSPESRWRNDERQMGIIYHEGIIYQTAGSSVYALDAATGDLKWSHTDEGPFLYYPSLSRTENRLFVAACTDQSTWHRWPGASLKAILCLDASDGSTVWRNAEVGDHRAGQVVYHEGTVLYFTAYGIGGYGGERGEYAHMGLLRSSDGTVLWRKQYGRQVDPGFSWTWVGQVGMFQHDELHVAEAGGYYLYNKLTGDFTEPRRLPVPNQRCNRARGADDLFFSGMTVVANGSREFCHASVTRSDCATGAFPANGMLYYTPNGCGCVTQLRGYQGYSSGSPGEPVPDGERLETSSGFSKRTVTREAAKAGIEYVEAPLAKTRGDQPTGVPRIPVRTACPIRDEWHNNDMLPHPETAPVLSNVRSYVAVVNEHRMEARTGPTVDWSFTADGRISSPPVVEDGRVMFGAHDGHVYCLRESDGGLLWRYLAARNRRKITAYAQLESAWPVFGVVMHKGLVCFSAGRHPEVDEGIYVGGLVPGTGELRWKGVIYPHDLQWVSVDTRPKEEERRNNVINEVMQVNGDLLTLPGASIDPNNPPSSQVSTEKNRNRSGRAPLALGTMSFSVPVAGPAKVAVFDLSGKRVRMLFDGVARGGRNAYHPEGIELPAGCYTLVLRWKGRTVEKKLLVRR